MNEQIIISSDESERVLIVSRDDGRFTYRRQWKQAEGWGAEGPDCGIYDSAETALCEAASRIAWLQAEPHASSSMSQ